MSLWCRRALDEQAALDESLGRMEERVMEPRELLIEGGIFGRDLAGPAKPFPRR